MSCPLDMPARTVSSTTTPANACITTEDGAALIGLLEQIGAAYRHSTAPAPPDKSETWRDIRTALCWEPVGDAYAQLVAAVAR